MNPHHHRPKLRPSRHACAPMQGHGIEAKALDLVLQYGTEEQACAGRTLVRLDHDLRREFERDCPELRDCLGIYIILASDAVDTVCHDDRRLRRHLH
jgi:hypothetical protein